MFDMYKDNTGVVSDKDYKKEQKQTMAVINNVMNNYDYQISSLGVEPSKAAAYAWTTLKNNKFVEDMLLEFDNTPYFVVNGCLTYDKQFKLNGSQFSTFIGNCINDLMEN